MSLKTDRPGQHKNQEFIEIVDESDSPLAVLSLEQAHRQKLRHRAVLVLVFNSENKLYLRKRDENKTFYPGRWDISAGGHVNKGESRERAAIRRLRQDLGLSVERLKLLREMPADPSTGFEFLTLYSTGGLSDSSDLSRNQDTAGMFVDEDEISFLIEQFPEMLTPGLVRLWEKQLIFPGERAS